MSLGATLNSAARFAEAIPQLEHYVKIAPGDLAGHYQLSLAYARTGRKEDAARETALHQKLLEKSQAAQNARTNAKPQ